MLGFVLTILSSFFNEVSDVIGKQKMRQGEVSVWTTGFLTLIFGIILFLVAAFIRGSFHFSIQSLPTLIPRIILEIILSWITITTLSRANRSTFGFVRTLTIPLLLLADIIMGYGVGQYQVIGMLIITVAITFFVGFSGRIEKRGIGFLLLSATLPVFTLSLFKYNITHFNSIETEQIIVSLAILIFFYIMAIYKAKEKGPIIPPEEKEGGTQIGPEEKPIVEYGPPETGEGTVHDEPKKYYPLGVEVKVINERVQYMDERGKLITESLKDYTKRNILQSYASLNEFLTAWTKTEQKEAILKELEERGVFFAELSAEVGRDLDAFDLICHVAWGKKPLTRNERAEKARKKDYFTKYEGKAREVIDALLAKYADQGITAIDDIGDLQVSPFDQFGTPYQIVNDIFGGREKYIMAVKEVQQALYAG